MAPVICMLPHAAEETKKVVCHAGYPAYWVLVSWLYALYSFDYKWSLTNKQLLQRILFFERHWAFFAGLPSTMSLHTWFCNIPSCHHHLQPDTVGIERA